MPPNAHLTQASLDHALFASATAGDFKHCSELLALGANAKHSESLALRRAARGGRLDCVALLLPLSDAKACDSQALREAAVNNHAECVQLLIASSEPKTRESLALRLVAEAGFVDCLKLLIPVSDACAAESTALRWAAENGHLECVELLLAAGSDPGVDNCLAFSLAVKNNHADCARLLIPFASAENQSIAFEAACDAGAARCAQLLIHCADSPRIHERCTFLAINGGHAEVFLLLANHAPEHCSLLPLSAIRDRALQKGHGRLARALFTLIENESIAKASSPAPPCPAKNGPRL